MQSNKRLPLIVGKLWRVSLRCVSCKLCLLRHNLSTLFFYDDKSRVYALHLRHKCLLGDPCGFWLFEHLCGRRRFSCTQSLIIWLVGSGPFFWPMVSIIL